MFEFDKKDWEKYLNASGFLMNIQIFMLMKLFSLKAKSFMKILDIIHR